MGEEEEQKEKPVQERLCKVGKVIVGRLNIHHPEDGTPTKYYINWCNRAFDNILMTHEEMRRIFGSLAPLKVGMYFEIEISHVPEDPKVHPAGINAKQVPVPAHKLKRNKRRNKNKRNLRKKNKISRRSPMPTSRSVRKVVRKERKTKRRTLGRERLTSVAG